MSLVLIPVLLMFIVFLGAQNFKFLACGPIEGPLLLLTLSSVRKGGQKRKASKDVNNDTSQFFRHQQHNSYFGSSHHA